MAAPRDDNASEILISNDRIRDDTISVTAEDRAGDGHFSDGWVFLQGVQERLSSRQVCAAAVTAKVQPSLIWSSLI